MCEVINWVAKIETHGVSEGMMSPINFLCYLFLGFDSLPFYIYLKFNSINYRSDLIPKLTPQTLEKVQQKISRKLQQLNSRAVQWWETENFLTPFHTSTRMGIWISHLF